MTRGKQKLRQEEWIKREKGQSQGFKSFPTGVQIMVTNSIHCFTASARGVHRRNSKVWECCQEVLRIFSSYRIQTITGKFQVNRDLEHNAFSDKLMQGKKKYLYKGVSCLLFSMLSRSTGNKNKRVLLHRERLESIGILA